MISLDSGLKRKVSKYNNYHEEKKPQRRNETQGILLCETLRLCG
jgi:hypothetical protein